LTEASRSDEGSVRFDLLQQISRPNHLTVVEIWSNQKAVDTHGMAAHKKQFREKLTPLSGSLYDERLYKVFN
jgi:quinol monooxygenase YgiN